MIIQYDFFRTEEEIEREEMMKRIQEIKDSTDKVRRGLFSRHGELFKKLNDVDERLSIIEKNICKQG